MWTNSFYVYLLSFALFLCVAAEQRRTSGFCPCAKPDDEFMVACDGQRCRYQWFHFVCVGLDGKSIPAGDWYCPECVGKHLLAHCFMILIRFLIGLDSSRHTHEFQKLHVFDFENMFQQCFCHLHLKFTKCVHHKFNFVLCKFQLKVTEELSKHIFKIKNVNNFLKI